ncbi:LPXTG cell wall anchor domain-containing protein [Micromonospora sp. DT44]|uniref:LPXTG cell wall anchor domain-containing protein n=1 Tax=Micromonospora sp. DT44 TaxID=3393439 RepID=UPI003CF6FA94
MGNRAARWLIAVSAGLVIAVPMLGSGELPATAFTAVRVAPSEGTRVTFEVVPTATPQPSPSTPQPSPSTPQPSPSTPQPTRHPHRPTPSHGGKLPVTGSGGGSVLFLLALGVTLVAIGWLVARRRRPN